MKEPHTDRKFTNRAENPLLHDTWKLLSRYRDVTWSLELSVQQMKKSFEIEYGTSIDEFLDSVYLAGAELTGTNIEYQAKCIERSNKMLKLVDSSIDLLRNKHKNGETFYWVLYYTCLLYTSSVTFWTKGGSTSKPWSSHILPGPATLNTETVITVSYTHLSHRSARTR